MDPKAYLRKALGALGYRGAQLCSDYEFAAVDQPAAPIRNTAIATFFDVPPSYRNAAVAVVEVSDEGPLERQLDDRRALGAPFLIALGKNDEVSAWTVTSRGVAKVDSAAASDLKSFFDRHAAAWRPESIRRLKAPPIRRAAGPQLSLFDPIALYTIQAQVHEALDRLLRDFLAFFESKPRSQLSLERDYQLLLPLIFRLLTGKILYDRGDLGKANTPVEDPQAVIQYVTNLYSLADLPLDWSRLIRKQLAQAWSALRSGLFVRNIAADDLAYVYENTLITPQTRRKLGTHSTPTPVAEYVLRSFNFPMEVDAIQRLRVFEPFAGSCVFLTAAMRRFKELLPASWSPAQMHRHLVAHFTASEVDGFAAEIARLALILADYPNPNGWRIRQEDLFHDNALTRRVREAEVVVCNPPFEAFSRADAGSLNEASAVHKPLAALEVFLQERPRFLGIVMPAGFATHAKFRSSVERLVESYRDVELLELPEGMFPHATVGAKVIIAQEPRLPEGSTTTRLCRSVIKRADVQRFSQTLEPSLQEKTDIDYRRAPGLVGLRPLRNLWEYLREYPKLGSLVEIHRGLEWNIPQSQASVRTARAEYKKGLHRIAESLAQFRILNTVYLNCRTQDARGGAINLPWARPKVICSAIRTSRGPWRISATEDLSGMVASQQFFGMWPKRESCDLVAIAAILNSPLANAFSEAHDTEKGLRVSVMKEIPIPDLGSGEDLHTLVKKYRDAFVEREETLFANRQNESLRDILLSIDALLLSRYDLPPKLEKALLKHVSEGSRPCGHAFGQYPGVSEPGAISLFMHLNTVQRPGMRANWNEVLKPLPLEIADVFDAV
ncbi:MAG: DNA methyltransferase [Burkholderiales bacterium]